VGAGAGENRETGEGIQSLCLPFCRRSSLLFLAHAHFSHILTESEFSLIFSLSLFFSLFFSPPLFSPSFFPSFYFVLRIKIFSCSSLSLCACVALLVRKFFFLRLDFIRFGFIFKLLLSPRHALLVT